MTVKIISFGYGHGESPPAHLTVDVRDHFRDPHVRPELRHLTAYDPPVMQAVMDTPGVARLIHAITDTVIAFTRGPVSGPVVVAIGCVGGRHRSAAIAIRTGRLLRRAGIPATVEHRDLRRAVIERNV